FLSRDPTATRTNPLSLHDALPILAQTAPERIPARVRIPTNAVWETVVFELNVLAFIFIGLQIRPILGSLDADEDEREDVQREHRSEEHTSELQSRRDLVCRLLLAK